MLMSLNTVVCNKYFVHKRNCSFASGSGVGSHRSTTTLESNVLHGRHHYLAPPCQHLPSHGAGLQGDYRRPTNLPKACSPEELKGAFRPEPVRKSELPLKDIVSSARTPQWVTSNAASETFEFVEVIMRRFCQQQNAWAQAPLSWLCLCCRVGDLLIRRIGLVVC